MPLHQGKTIEQVIRRSGHSFSRVARLTKVSRRSVYNWLNQSQVNPQIIQKIGKVINHDFSIEFPELFSSEDFSEVPAQPGSPAAPVLSSLEEEVSKWKNKYIEILERYNELLVEKLS
jgi:predicted transcriptional regulator